MFIGQPHFSGSCQNSCSTTNATLAGMQGALLGDAIGGLIDIYKKRHADKSRSLIAPPRPAQDQFIRSTRLPEPQAGKGKSVRFGSGSDPGKKVWDFFTKTERERDYEQAHAKWKAIKYDRSATYYDREKALYQKERLKEKAGQSSKVKAGVAGLAGLAPQIATHVTTGDHEIAENVSA